MTDHAKTLADALRTQLMKNDAGYRIDIIKLEKALAAYDAHLAEAATRENTNAPNLHKD